MLFYSAPVGDSLLICRNATLSSSPCLARCSNFNVSRSIALRIQRQLLLPLCHHTFAMRYLFILSFASASWASSALRVRNQTLARPAVSVNTAALPQSSDVHSGHQRGGQDYVVLFDTQHPEPPDVANVLRQIGLDVSHPDVSHVFSNSAFRGFAGTMNNHCVSALNAMSAVSHVQRGFNMSTHSVASRKGSPWGLQRVSQSTAVAGADGRLAFDYQYEDGGELGAGVDLYVLDSGINTEHQDFGGRAKMVFPEALANQVDGLGHGTHCAGTAAGSVYGVASGANVLGVKVVTDDNTAPISDVVAGVDFIIRNHDRRRSDPSFVGSVVSISFGTLSDPTSGDTPLYNAVVRQATAAGVHVSMSAGNHADDACKFTPASAGGQNGDAVTVGRHGTR